MKEVPSTLEKFKKIIITATATAQSVKFMFSNVAYRPTVYETGLCATIIYCLLEIHRWAHGLKDSKIPTNQGSFSASFNSFLFIHSAVWSFFCFFLWILGQGYIFVNFFPSQDGIVCNFLVKSRTYVKWLKSFLLMSLWSVTQFFWNTKIRPKR